MIKILAKQGKPLMHLGIERNRMSIMLEVGDIAYIVESKLINNQEIFNYKRLTVM